MWATPASRFKSLGFRAVRASDRAAEDMALRLHVPVEYILRP